MTTLDLDARYNYRGIAAYLLGRCNDLETAEREEMEDKYGESWGGGYWEDDEILTPPPLSCPDTCHIAVWVGDDTPHHVDASDLIPLRDDDYCGGCGQVGCSADRMGAGEGEEAGA